MTAPDTSLQASVDESALQEKLFSEQKPIWSLKRWFGKDDIAPPSSSSLDQTQRPGVARRFSRKVIPGLPRPGTFKRQQSELRDNLEPIIAKPNERRAVSVDRRRNVHARELSRPCEQPLPRVSAPVVMDNAEAADYSTMPRDNKLQTQASEVSDFAQVSQERGPAMDENAEAASLADAQSASADGFDDELLAELEKTWILNLSMHFRDRSNREKFFVTFAESPSYWRRVTISLDYRDAPPGSLEEDLQQTRFQRDKSARIYESIRDSLRDIQFYDTVTNLKLKTENDRLHVHVTEDIHEVIQYPPITAIHHLHCRRIREDALVFDSHLSGFVYKVRVHDEVFIKKEIPGPDTVEEFLYEINALHRLSGSDSVIQFGGVIIDNEERVLKGLLISFAEKGALIDVIFDGKGELSWGRRERWARQIVQGLSEIHEAGFVQGDFTLSNIVIDGNDKAKIIDINRRGCPVGWEPPEVAALIESKQRISMYIGVKSDIFQLGMVLWAIAMEQDEPEVQVRPLTLTSAPDEIPSYYRAIVGICLSDDPRRRCHATALLGMFPDFENESEQPHQYHQKMLLSDQYIDPATAVGRDDIDNYTRSSITHSYVNPPTDMSGEPYYYLNHQASEFHTTTTQSAVANIEPADSGREGDCESSYHQYHRRLAVAADNNDFVLDGSRGRSSSSRSDTDQVLVSEGANESAATDNPAGTASTMEREGVSQRPKRQPDGHEPIYGTHDMKSLHARIVNASPSRHHSLGKAKSISDKSISAFLPPDESIDRGSDRHGDTAPVPEIVPRELIGVGEHSAIDHSVFPQGVLDDDLTTDT